MTRYALRPATRDDLDFIRRVHAEAMRPHVERTFGAWDDAAQRALLLEKTRPETHEIVEVEGEPIGCRWVREHADALELVRLWLLARAQGKGIGRALVRDVLLRAARRKLPVRLQVLKVNPAQRLYGRLGFEVVGETETHLQLRHTLRPGPLAKVVTGGQTGADRAALDVACTLGIATGGWVPHGRRAEDGRVPDHYAGMRETESSDYAERTRRNVRDSDATLVLGLGASRGGTALTLEVARALDRPVLELDLEHLTAEEAAVRARVWLAETRPRILNVAGPRQSEAPRSAELAARVLHAALAPWVA